MSLNCCSLRSSLKKANFLALIDEYNPDIICGCESHLNVSYPSAEIFPNHYNVYRKDRVEGAGGVFVCVQKNLHVIEDPSLNVEAELVWIKIIFPKIKLIHLGCFYRPPDHKVNPILELQSSLDKIVCQSSGLPSIVLLGDFNLPSIAWSDDHGQISSILIIKSLRQISSILIIKSL